MKIYSFPPISDENTKVLILGTMPGAKSLALNQYYGHGGNHFWKIMFRMFDKEFSNDYEIKRFLLLNNFVGLWDVLKCCDREGSSDLAIMDDEPNNFEQFFKGHKNITHICFNGQNAEYYYSMKVRNFYSCKSIVLPSTSPANTWSTFEDKVDQWSKIKLLL